MKKITLLFPLVVISTSPAVFAEDFVRECNYEIMVKSSGGSVELPSKTISGGKIRSMGSKLATSLNDLNLSSDMGDFAKETARNHAMEAATVCMTDAIKSSKKPESCKTMSRKQLSAKTMRAGSQSTFMAMKNYSINNLAYLAKSELCQRRANQGISARSVRLNYDIFAVNVTDKKKSDRRKECRFGIFFASQSTESYHIKAGDYLPLEKGTISCTNAGKALTPQAPRSTPQEKRYSGYYDKSASKVKRIISGHCSKKFGARTKIEFFEVERNTGKIRAMFSCQ